MNKATTGKTKTVSFTLAANTPLSAQDQAQLAHLKSRAINFRDLPPSPADAVWTRPGVPFTGENKRQITLRLDVDVLDYFRHAGKRYQTRINNVLRAYMQAHESK
jgi:uncharacterized protein (DUF4415 family)